MAEALLEARGIKKYFPVTKGLVISRVTGQIKAVDGVSFSIVAGETLGLVGETGCGKTTTARVVLFLEKLTGGSILFQGQDIAHLGRAGLRAYRRAVQAVFQDPYSSLSPRMRVGDIIGEPISVNESVPRRAVQERVSELLQQVGLPPESAHQYPHEFSGGQRQRIAVARALAINPLCIVLDEPVSALDVSIRAQLINLLKELQERFSLGYLLIAHDLAAVHHMSNRIAVMYLGGIVESADSDELFANPLHPYTRALLSASLPLDPDSRREEIVLTGEVPSPLNPPSGCRFHPRCPFAMPICAEVQPVLKDAATRHQVACHLYP